MEAHRNPITVSCSALAQSTFLDRREGCFQTNIFLNNSLILLRYQNDILGAVMCFYTFTAHRMSAFITFLFVAKDDVRNCTTPTVCCDCGSLEDIGTLSSTKLLVSIFFDYIHTLQNPPEIALVSLPLCFYDLQSQYDQLKPLFPYISNQQM